MTDTDRHRFLERLTERVEGYQIRLYLYCLMANHVHLLLETPLGNLSQFMESLLTSYAVYFNRKHERSGHVTQGRYDSPLVEGNEYLLKLTRYIHLNPAYAKEWINRPIDERRAHLRNYRWSSYRAYSGLAEFEHFVDYNPVIMLVGQGARKPLLAYRRYVESGLAESDGQLRELLRQSSLGVGSQAFLADMERRYRELNEKSIRSEDVSFRRAKRKVAPSDVLEKLSRHFGISVQDLPVHRKKDWIKPIAAALLVKLSGLTQREIARQMGLSSGAAVSLQLKRLKDCSPGNVRRALAELERKFNI